MRGYLQLRTDMKATIPFLVALCSLSSDFHEVYIFGIGIKACVLIYGLLSGIEQCAIVVGSLFEDKSS